MKTTPISECPFCAYDKPTLSVKRRGKYMNDRKKMGDNIQVRCGRCGARGPIVNKDHKLNDGTIPLDELAVLMWNGTL